MASHLMTAAETCGSVREDNMMVAIGAVTEPARDETRVATREEDILVRAKPMMASARGLRRRHA
jgi:hypothetical protein